MKKLKDFEGKKIAIHFPTYELWLRREEINPSDNCKDGFWSVYNEKTCYFLEDREGGSYGNLGLAEDGNHTILPATDFLEEEFIYGQDYEFSDSEDFKITRIALYGCENPINKDGYKYVVFLKEGGALFTFKYARKINTERTESITTAKELIAKFDIKQEELFND